MPPNVISIRIENILCVVMEEISVVLSTIFFENYPFIWKLFTEYILYSKCSKHSENEG